MLNWIIMKNIYFNQNGIILASKKEIPLFNQISTQELSKLTSLFVNFVSDEDDLLLLNYYQRNFIVNSLNINIAGITITYLIIRDYNTKLKLHQKNLNNFDVNEFDEDEQLMIFALKNRYTRDKDIVNFLEKHNIFNYDVFKIQYSMKKLFRRFNLSDRCELQRKIYEFDLDKYYPENIFKPGVYNSNNVPLQLLQL